MGFGLRGFMFYHWIPTVLLWITLGIPSRSRAAFLEPPTSDSVITALQEEVARLPCRFEPAAEEVVQHVTWFKEVTDKDGKTTREQMILAHVSYGETEFDNFKGRVAFETKTPTSDAALLIKSSQLSDTGGYVCLVGTFPSGSFEISMELVVWISPISSLDPVSPPLVEGQGFNVAAICKSWGYPTPTIAWETELNGTPQTTPSEGGKVSSKYSLHPVRALNGKKLDCVITHPSFSQPRRLSHRLVVHYPPDVSVKGYDDNWYKGLEGARLTCAAGGNPLPQEFTWSRKGGSLPEGVASENNSLVFRRPLESDDAGVYVCQARNRVAKAEAELEIRVEESPRSAAAFSSLVIGIVAGVAGVLLVTMVIAVVLVNRYYKRKNKKLETELNVKTEEINTLSRQASFRRLNSVNIDPRTQTEENIPLRTEGTMRNSLSSLGDRGSKRGGWPVEIPGEGNYTLSSTGEAVDHPPRSRDSRSTMSAGRGSADYFTRGHSSPFRRSERGRGDPEEDRDGDRELEENSLNSRLRVESFVRNSNRSLESQLHPPLHPSLLAVERCEQVKPLNGTLLSRGGSSPDHGLPYDDMSEEGELDKDSETASSLLSDAMTNHFQITNGTLKPKPNSNGILIHPKGQMV
nr:PREDICTED: nectin-4 [Lepisosteus oculatus]